ncbi:sorting nexin-10B isoform X3 [Nerophis lumbriciformis]|uniref:sorting nexin-10B isoform X3 n=1 Tax=Nerophis lumbriciformis TaxID=546530 RepID=UPI002ADF73B4|nr:uncharacterized protein LOC133600711 isoform X3 [Nerophis lumbriciformis]XP_061809746.1 uncharacterized protein LOC133600711 isoform X3 [Nerophis lumbriciformis]
MWEDSKEISFSQSQFDVSFTPLARWTALTERSTASHLPPKRSEEVYIEDLLAEEEVLTPQKTPAIEELFPDKIVEKDVECPTVEDLLTEDAEDFFPVKSPEEPADEVVEGSLVVDEKAFLPSKIPDNEGLLTDNIIEKDGESPTRSRCGKKKRKRKSREPSRLEQKRQRIKQHYKILARTFEMLSDIV